MNGRERGRRKTTNGKGESGRGREQGKFLMGLVGDCQNLANSLLYCLFTSNSVVFYLIVMNLPRLWVNCWLDRFTNIMG